MLFSTLVDLSKSHVRLIANARFVYYFFIQMRDHVLPWLLRLISESHMAQNQVRAR